MHPTVGQYYHVYNRSIAGQPDYPVHRPLVRGGPAGRAVGAPLRELNGCPFLGDERGHTGDMGIYFWTGKLPVVLSAYSSPEDLHRHLCESGDTLVIMNQMPTEIYGLERAQAVMGLERVQEFNDSELYRCPALAPGS